MKEIQPVSIWYNGTMVLATMLNMLSTSDNLIDTSTFQYQLLSADKTILNYGNLRMEGNNYITYSTSPDSNAYAYSWGATQLNLTLV